VIGGLLLEVLLPRTDARVVAQLLALAVVMLLGSLLLRRQHELLLFTWGIGLVMLGGMGLRAFH
jgi:hypothetical protein